jgi:sucrose-6-phosphate hydrolase SacC (GH32 family)
MKKIIVALFLISLFSCGKKEIQLPQLNETKVVDVKDHSPIYMFFETNGKDTLIDVNRSNSISSTNWLFNIDKRLPLKLVIPEIQKLQVKKEKSSHKKEGSENYFTYMDSKKKTLAFLSFTNVTYTLKNYNNGISVFFTKRNKIFVNNILVDKKDLESYLNNLNNTYQEIAFGFDKNLSFQDYIIAKNVANDLEIKFITFKEYIY